MDHQHISPTRKEMKQGGGVAKVSFSQSGRNFIFSELDQTSSRGGLVMLLLLREHRCPAELQEQCPERPPLPTTTRLVAVVLEQVVGHALRVRREVKSNLVLAGLSGLTFVHLLRFFLVHFLRCAVHHHHACAGWGSGSRTRPRVLTLVALESDAA